MPSILHYTVNGEKLDIFLCALLRLGASKFCGQILEFTGVVPSALNGIAYLFSNFSPHKGTKCTKESQLPSIPLCPSCLCAKHHLYH